MCLHNSQSCFEVIVDVLGLNEVFLLQYENNCLTTEILLHFHREAKYGLSKNADLGPAQVNQKHGTG